MAVPPYLDVHVPQAIADQLRGVMLMPRLRSRMASRGFLTMGSWTDPGSKLTRSRICYPRMTLLSFI